MLIALLFPLIASTYAFIAPCPVQTSCQEGCNPEIVDPLLNLMAQKGIFTEDDGPDRFESFISESFSAGGSEYTFTGLYICGSRYGNRSKRVKLTVNVVGECRIKVNILFKHHPQADDPPPTEFFSPIPTVYHYRPESIEVAIKETKV